MSKSMTFAISDLRSYINLCQFFRYFIEDIEKVGATDNISKQFFVNLCSWLLTKQVNCISK